MNIRPMKDAPVNRPVLVWDKGDPLPVLAMLCTPLTEAGWYSVDGAGDIVLGHDDGLGSGMEPLSPVAWADPLDIEGGVMKPVEKVTRFVWLPVRLLILRGNGRRWDKPGRLVWLRRVTFSRLDIPDPLQGYWVAWEHDNQETTS